MKERMILLTALVMILAVTPDWAQRKSKKQEPAPAPEAPVKMVDAKEYSGMTFRNIGPFRGGRAVAVCGVVQDPYTFYFGSTGGGVWKTENGGETWKNITDGYLKTGSIGAIDVSRSDPNVVVVGTGEGPVRGVMTSHGDGVYISTDGGATWSNKGLDRVRQIPKVRIHPQDPNIIYVAAQGSPYAPTPDRGVYRTLDGGKNWEKVLFVNDSAGVCDLSMDMTNPRVLYAAFWHHQRLPWKMVSGGQYSSIWKTTDGGDTWTKLTKGLPKSIMGKIGVSVSAADPQRVYAVIESEEGGLYRSDDAGNSWTRINKDRILQARSWYYMHVFADPHDANRVVVLNAPYLLSEDGGKTFRTVPTPHGDNHDLWVHPLDLNIQINSNDGGANISYNRGLTWSTQANQPTAQFYRINADNRFPYYVYGGQQDNTSVCIPSRSDRPGIANSEFYPVGGCESAYCAFDPDNPRFVYAGCYQGIISETDTELKISKDIMAYPYLGLGSKPSDVKYRFNWNAPILVSQHDPKVIYHGGNQVLKSSDRGTTWSEISPDLTRNDPNKLDFGGGPITNEGAGGEVYQAVYYLAESPFDANELWAGSDDGLVHMTRDGGQNWADVTPPGLMEGQIKSLEVSPNTPGKVYVIYNHYKFNDFKPHIYITTDFGKTWTDHVQGIAPEAHVRVVREDPVRKDLLFAGTETGLYISINGGMQWDSFQLNLPVVPITDLMIHHGDLLVATQGRAFWIMDDLTPLREMQPKTAGQVALLAPRDPILFGGPRRESLTMGTNPDYGLALYYQVNEKLDSSDIKIRILDDHGKILNGQPLGANKKELDKMPGLHKYVWDMHVQDKPEVKGVLTLGGRGGHLVTPGKYTVRVVVGKDSIDQTFMVDADPRLDITDPAAYQEKRKLLDQLDAAARSLNEEVNTLTAIKQQLEDFVKRPGLDTSLKRACTEVVKSIEKVDKTLVQRKQQTFQDVINFPNQLDAELKHIEGLLEDGYLPVTNGQKMRVHDVMDKWEKSEVKINELYKKVGDLNQMIQEAAVPVIQVDRKAKT